MGKSNKTGKGFDSFVSSIITNKLPSEEKRKQQQLDAQDANDKFTEHVQEQQSDLALLQKSLQINNEKSAGKSGKSTQQQAVKGIGLGYDKQMSQADIEAQNQIQKLKNQIKNSTQQDADKQADKKKTSEGVGNKFNDIQKKQVTGDSKQELMESNKEKKRLKKERQKQKKLQEKQQTQSQQPTKTVEHYKEDSEDEDENAHSNKDQSHPRTKFQLKDRKQKSKHAPEKAPGSLVQLIIPQDKQELHHFKQEKSRVYMRIKSFDKMKNDELVKKAEEAGVPMKHVKKFRTKTRSKQKNLKKDKRPIEVKKEKLAQKGIELF